MQHHVSIAQLSSSSVINELLVGPLVASVVDDLEAWRIEDWKRTDKEEATSATELMRGIQLALNVGHAAMTVPQEAPDQLLAVHDRLLQELRNLRDAFAPDEEIRASAARLRLHKNMVMPVTAEHHAIAVDAGLLFDELTERYNALVFPSRGFQSAFKKAN
jgi:hypothetical protein